LKILIAADSGNNFGAAMEFLKTSSWAADNEFKLVHVIEPSDVTDLWLSMSGATRHREILAERQEHALSTIETIKIDCRTILGNQCKVESDVIVGKLDQVVLDVALSWAAELVVVGLPESTFISRCIGTGKFSRTFSESPCPVTFARTSKSESKRAS
jgi:nucleotide-binding universal stress UspA family protein